MTADRSLSDLLAHITTERDAIPDEQIDESEWWEGYRGALCDVLQWAALPDAARIRITPESLPKG